MYLAVDEGTTNIKIVIFDEEFKALKIQSEKVPIYYPREGWVEQEPEDIWRKIARKVNEIDYKVDAIGITNQRETTVLWDAKTGKVIHRAIVWQCRRTAEMMESLAKEYGEEIKKRTGLEMDAYFSASKIKWILDHVPDAREKAERGEIKFGTMDTYLVWKFTGVHATDHTNASRTMLYNINEGDWDPFLLGIFEIPEEILPDIKNSADFYGYAKIKNRDIPITGVIGDQQSSLLAHGGVNKGDMKVTYGTGTFMLVNTGNENFKEKGILSTVAWSIKKRRDYALEGSILSSGTVVEWLKSLGLWSEEVGEETSLFFVPAFNGLGSPYWDPYARGTILGISPYIRKEHIVRGALESIAYMVRDIVEVMKKHVEVSKIMADGGMTHNDFLMQFQADILDVPVRVPEFEEMTSRGAAIAAALGIGSLKIEDVRQPEKYREYLPKKDGYWREKRYEMWKDAVKRSMRWSKNASRGK